MVDDNVTHASKLTSFVNKHLRKGPSEPFFDDIVDLAIQLYRAPMAVVAFANETGYWFKAQRGLHIQAIDNTAHLLARTLGADAPLVVANNMRDDAAAMLVHEFYRVFDGDDVAGAVFVAITHHRSE